MNWRRSDEKTVNCSLHLVFVYVRFVRLCGSCMAAGTFGFAGQQRHDFAPVGEYACGLEAAGQQESGLAGQGKGICNLDIFRYWLGT